MEENNILYSYHTFIYPFYMKNADPNRVKGLLEKRCDKVYIDNLGKDYEDYIVEQNCFQYFFPQIQNILFNRKDQKAAIIDHYKLKIISEDDYYYCVERKNQSQSRENEASSTYRLPISNVKIDISSQLNIGVIRFELSYDGDKLEDVLIINDIGRRLYSPARDKQNPDSAILTSSKISIENKNGDSLFDIVFPTDEFSSEIKAFEKLLFGENTEIKIVSILDDRMFTMCAVVSSSLMSDIQKDELDKKRLYEFYFVDSPDYCSCQNKKTIDGILKEHSYDRWVDAGTIYGLSEFSFMMITNGEASHIIDAFLSIYVNMAELVLLQRAALVRLDLDASKAVPDDNFMIDNIKELQQNKMYFENNLYAEEVTFQQQGIEINDMLKKFLRVKVLKGEVEKKISSLYAYINTQNEKHNKELADTISIFTLLSLLTATYNQFKKFNTAVVITAGVIAILGMAMILARMVVPAFKERKTLDQNLKAKTHAYIVITVANILLIISDLWDIVSPLLRK